jgi:uncharacterized protein YigE (DUF2233 family)
MGAKTGRLVGIAAATLITVAAVGAAAVRVEGSSPSLAVRDTTGWTTWWRGDAPPARWNGDSELSNRVVWRAGAAGLEWGELQLSGSSEAWRTRVIVVRVDPRRVRFSLIPAFAHDVSWTVADADTTAIVALDAGQFLGRLPWGWVVSGGKEVLPPQHAPLAGAVVVESSGEVRIVAPDSVAFRRDSGGVVEAFQSYPMLLFDGRVPLALRQPGLGVNLMHRDARLAIGTLEDGRVLVALTRFDAFGPRLGRVPFGLTTPEMAAVMGALGARHALLLDGGISGQLMLRGSDGTPRSWRGTRAVPLGLEARSR